MAQDTYNAPKSGTSPGWPLLLQAPAIALRGRVLLLAVAGVLVVGLGDRLLEADSVAPKPIAELSISELPMASLRMAGDAYATLVQPFVFVAQGNSIGVNLVRCALRLAVWGLVGGAIARIASLALTRNENPNLQAAVKYTWLHKSGFVGGPVLLLAGLLLLVAPLGIARLAMQVSWLSAVAGVLWPIVMVAAILATLYAIGAVVGWPLLVAAAAADGSDAFDAVSRMFAYVYQKPLRLLGYLLLVGALAAAAAVAGQLFTTGVLYATTLATAEVASPFAASAIAWWNSLAASLVSVYLTGLVFTSASGVYLLRRQDVDGVHVDEVFIDSAEFGGGLPAASEGSTGVPQLDEQPAEAA